MASSVAVTFSASIKDLIDATDRVKASIEGIKESADKVTDGFKSLLEVAGIAFSVDKIAEFIGQMGELGETTERMKAILGVSTEEVGRLDAVAKGTGTSTEQLARGFEVFQANLQKAQAGSGPAAAALTALGLAAKDFIGLPFDAQVKKFADAQAKFADGGNKLAVVRALWGRMGDDLIPLFDKGSKGFDELAGMAERAGTALSGKTAEAFEATHLKLVELDMSVQGLGTRIFATLEPAIDRATTAITRFIESIDTKTINTSIKTVVDAIGEFVVGVVNFFEIATTQIEKLMVRARYLSDFGLKAFSSDLREKMFAEMDAIDAGAKVKGAELEQTLRGYLKTIDDFLSAQGGAGGEGAPGPGNAKPQMPATDASGGGAKAASADLDGTLKVLQLKFQAVKDELDSEVKLNEISAATKFDILIGEAEKEKDAELALLQSKAALYAQGSAQYEQIQAKMAEVRQKYDNEEKKDLQQKIQDYAKTYDQIGSTVLGAWNSQLKGLLAGTTSWATAMKNIFADLTLKIIEYFEEQAVKWAATEIANTVAHNSGNAARVASDTAAEGATLPTRIAKFTSDITSDAAATFAGIFANMAPLLGPAAAGPAAAGQATVLAELANVPKLDVGGYVQSTGIALIHAGETVTPAAVVQSGGGGHTFNFAISAIDARSVRDMFMSNQGGLRDAMLSILRNQGFKPA